MNGDKYRGDINLELTLFSKTAFEHATGTMFNDEIEGNRRNNILIGGNGHDEIEGESGDDLILGGDGNDELEGDFGNDVIDGGPGDDEIEGGGDEGGGHGGGAGNSSDSHGLPVNNDGRMDIILGGAGHDEIDSDHGDDLVDGEAGNDEIRGRQHDDVLLGGGGRDDIRGDSGRDLLEGNADRDKLKGGSGKDEVYQDTGPGLLGLRQIFEFYATIYDLDGFYFVDPNEGNPVPSEDRPPRQWLQPLFDEILESPWLGSAADFGGRTSGVSGEDFLVVFDLDIDGNGVVDALTDGLLILGFLFDLEGEALTDGVIAPDATRTAEAIVELLTRFRSLFDIDGDGQTNALTDGLLILGYLFELRGEALTEGLVSEEATRSSPELIGDYISFLLLEDIGPSVATIVPLDLPPVDIPNTPDLLINISTTVADLVEGNRVSFRAELGGTLVNSRPPVYLWNFGDGSQLRESGAGSSHSFNDDGVYTVSVSVADGNGGQVSATTSVQISNIGPIFELDLPRSASVGEVYGGRGSIDDPGDDIFEGTVTIINVLSGQSVVEVLEILNDSQEFEFMYVFNEAGIYRVEVRVSDDEDEENFQVYQVTVV